MNSVVHKAVKFSKYIEIPNDFARNQYKQKYIYNLKS